MYADPFRTDTSPTTRSPLQSFAYLGRFVEPDPLGYEDNANLYQYALDDPVNLADPLGLEADIVISALRPCANGTVRLNGSCSDLSSLSGGGGAVGDGSGGSFGGGGGEAIVVIGKRPAPVMPPPEEEIVVTAPHIHPAGPAVVLASAPIHGPWTYGNYCGAGGSGKPIDKLDEACKKHDECYARNGLGPMSNFDLFPNPALRQCNQDLCDAAKGRGSRGYQIRVYFKNMPMPYNACRWDR
jgi:hypothetical protein